MSQSLYKHAKFVFSASASLSTTHDLRQLPTPIREPTVPSPSLAFKACSQESNCH